jgi:uncharacterized protein (TIGR02453 family)
MKMNKKMINHNFQGFSPQLPEYFKDLGANNNKQWFEASKSVFQKFVIEPALQFITAMQPIVSKFDPPLKAEARLNGSLRRIHRDIRFSKDKTPYNPRLHIIFWAGSHPNRSPACHIVLSANHLGIGAGQWGFEKDQLVRYRDCLTKPKQFSALNEAINNASENGQFLDPPSLKKVPKGYLGDGVLADYLRQKSIVVRNHDEPYPEEVFNDNCLDYFQQRLLASHPVNHWLLQNIRD